MVTMLMVDPHDRRTVWAGVGVDGVYRSLDCGDTWTHVQGGVRPDIHGMAISPGESNEVLAGTPREIYATTGKFALPYSRGIAFKAGDPNVLFAATGDTAIGSIGAIQCSTDGGRSLRTPSVFSIQRVSNERKYDVDSPGPNLPCLSLVCGYYHSRSHHLKRS